MSRLETPLAGSASGRDRPGGLRKRRGISFPRTICVQACTTRTETDPGADKGGLQTAGSLRAVRHTSGRFSRRPGPSLRPPKEAGDIVSAHNLRRRLHHTHKMDSRARAGVRGGLHTAGSLRAVRHTSGGFSQRPGPPPRRPQKEVGKPASLRLSVRRVENDWKNEKPTFSGNDWASKGRKFPVLVL